MRRHQPEPGIRFAKILCGIPLLMLILHFLSFIW